MLTARVEIIAMSRHDYNFLLWFRPRKKIDPCLLGYFIFMSLHENSRIFKGFGKGGLKIQEHGKFVS